MVCPGVGKDTTPMQTLPRFLLLLFILLTMGACSSPGYPRYQPFMEGSASAHPQGYEDIQLDGTSYLILYRNYFRFSLMNGLLISPFDDKWLQGAQEYVLHRAGELAKSKGGKYFIVLYKDDWNLISAWVGYKSQKTHVEPGAGIVIRVLSDYPSSIQPDDARVHEIDTLLQKLKAKNSGLAEYLGESSQDQTVRAATDGFSRWRSLVYGNDSPSIPGIRQKTIFGSEDTKFEPGRTITPLTPSGQFEFAIWDERLIAPLQFLAECIKFADQEKHEVFTLKNWTVEEHGNINKYGKAWFLTKATIILQHQKEPASLDAVFVVDELRQNIDVTKVKP